MEQPIRPRQQPRQAAPLPLQVVAVVLALTGIAELALAIHGLGAALAATMHVTDIPVITLPRHMQSPVARTLAGLLDFLLPIAPGMTLLIGAVVSMGAACIVWRGRRQRWRYVGAGLALVAAFNIAIMLPLLTTVSMRIGPSDLTLPPLPRAQRPLSVAASRPGPGAPTRPVTVERVLTDETATYVEYRIPDEPRDGQPEPVLVDDHGRRYAVNELPFVSFTFREFLNQLMPWRAPVREQAIFPPLPSGAHFATVRFRDVGFGTVLETVHIPLSPRGEVRSSPVILAKAHGILLRVTVARGMFQGRLDVTAEVARGLAPRRGLSNLTFNGRFIDAHAQPVTPLQFDSTCQATAAPNGHRHCKMWLTFKRPRPGARLKLEIHNVVLYDQYDHDHSYPITWSSHSWFVMP
jgi:hypothetical protein